MVVHDHRGEVGVAGEVLGEVAADGPGPVQPERPVTVTRTRWGVPPSCGVSVWVLGVGRFFQQVCKWDGQVDVDCAGSGVCSGV